MILKQIKILHIYLDIWEKVSAYVVIIGQLEFIDFPHSVNC